MEVEGLRSVPELKEAVDQLTEARKLSAALEDTISRLSQKDFKKLPKDLLIVQTYVITVQKQAIEVLLNSLRSNDGIQFQLKVLLDTSSTIQSAYKHAIDSVRSDYENQIKALNRRVSQLERSLEDSKATIEALTTRLELLKLGR